MEHEVESGAAAFARYQQSATGRMRVLLAARNLELLHDLRRPLRILDAGGGNGLNTDWLVQRGHEVTLLDPDPEMLEQARRRWEHTEVRRRATLVHGTIAEITETFAGQRFDLVVCHHVVEYLDDPRKAVADFHAVAAPDGELSLVTLNPVSEVIRAIMFEKDGALARARLIDRDYDAKWFGPARLYDLDEVVAWGARSGWTLKGFRSIRVLADYLAEEEYTEARRREMLALEETLAGREPYKRMGRYLQFGFTTAAPTSD